MYTFLLNKLRFNQISCSGSSGTRWQYGVPKWYEMVKRLGTPGLKNVDLQNIRFWAPGLLCMTFWFLSVSLYYYECPPVGLIKSCCVAKDILKSLSYIIKSDLLTGNACKVIK